MKKLFYIALCAIFFASCSDKVYEEINTDPTKADVVNPASQLAYSMLQIYGDMTYIDVHRLYTYAFTQHLMGCYNTTNYGGLHRASDNEMSRPWSTLYPGAIRNLTDGIYRTADDPTKANINAALRIFRVYVGGLLTDYYGDIPYSEAGLSVIKGIAQPKYDTQEAIYRSFFAELKAAVQLFDSNADAISSDPLFNGDLRAWKIFANSLRLRYAMRISDRLPALAEQEFKAALADGVMAGLADDACVKHMTVSYIFGQEAYSDFRGNALSKIFYGNDPANNPTYICSTFWHQLYDNKDPRTTLLCRFYIDDYMSVTSPEGRIDVTDAVMATDSLLDSTMVRPVLPGMYSWKPWPTYTVYPGTPIVDKMAEVHSLHPDFDPASSNPRWQRPKLANDFLQSNNPGVLMTYAEVCFLRAEAAAMGWATGDDAKTMYETGIRAAMDFLSEHYGCNAVIDADYATYIAQPNIAYNASKAKEQINTQAWILHFHNPAEAWANVRRSDYPALNPPTGDDEYPVVDDVPGIPVRLCYPLKEESYSKTEYDAAKGRVSGVYNWHARLWWDVK